MPWPLAYVVLGTEHKSFVHPSQAFYQLSYSPRPFSPAIKTCRISAHIGIITPLTCRRWQLLRLFQLYDLEWVCVCMYGVDMCKYASWRQKAVGARSRHQVSSSVFHNFSFSWNLELATLVRLASQWTPGAACLQSCFPQMLGLQKCATNSAFTWMLGIWTLVLVFVPNWVISPAKLASWLFLFI